MKLTLTFRSIYYEFYLDGSQNDSLLCTKEVPTKGPEKESRRGILDAPATSVSLRTRKTPWEWRVDLISLTAHKSSLTC